MISSGDNFEIKIRETPIRVNRVWGSGVHTCGDYWIGLEKIAYFVLPGFSGDRKDGRAVVLFGGEVVCDEPVDGMEDAMRLIEKELSTIITVYGKKSLKSFQGSRYFNRGEMPVVFEMEK